MPEVKINVTKFFKNNGSDERMKIRIIKDPGKRTGYFLVFKNNSVMKQFLKHVIDRFIK